MMIIGRLQSGHVQFHQIDQWSKGVILILHLVAAVQLCEQRTVTCLFTKRQMRHSKTPTASHDQNATSQTNSFTFAGAWEFEGHWLQWPITIIIYFHFYDALRDWGSIILIAYSSQQSGTSEFLSLSNVWVLDDMPTTVSTHVLKSTLYFLYKKERTTQEGFDYLAFSKNRGSAWSAIPKAMLWLVLKGHLANCLKNRWPWNDLWQGLLSFPGHLGQGMNQTTAAWTEQVVLRWVLGLSRRPKGATEECH